MANYLITTDHAGGVARSDRRSRSALTRTLEQLINKPETANAFEVSPLSESRKIGNRSHALSSTSA